MRILAALVLAAACEDGNSPGSPAGIPARLLPLPTGHDTALAGTELAQSPRFRVIDSAGNPIAGYPVTFATIPGEGTVQGYAALTEADGVASAPSWRLGLGVGPQQLRAFAGGTTASFTATADPLAVNGVFVTLVTGRQHSCGLTVDGSAFCWGKNDDGRLGDLTVVNRSVPVRVQTAFRFVKIAPGFDHTCGLTTDGTALCWGRKLDPDLVASRPEPRPTVVPTSLRFAEIATGAGQTCALTFEGQGYCWGGANGSNQLGNGSLVGSLTPVPVASDERFHALSSWLWSTCALNAAGTPYCWGYPTQAKPNQIYKTPTRIEGVTGLRTLSMGATYGCGISFDGSTWCWKFGAPAERLATVPPLRQISVGIGACAIATFDGTLLCWVGPFDPAASPTPVARGLNVRDVSVSGYQCVLTTLDAPYCWGVNDAGDLGNGTLRSADRPTPVTPP